MYEHLKPHTDKLEEIQNIRDEKFYSFVKTVITIAAGIIAVLVSLKNKQSISQAQRVVFTTTVALLSGGIVFGSILLYTEITMLDRLRKAWEEEIKELLKDNSKIVLMATAKHGAIYKISKWGMVVCFLLSLIFLTIYSY